MPPTFKVSWIHTGSSKITLVPKQIAWNTSKTDIPQLSWRPAVQGPPANAGDMDLTPG